MLGHVTADEVIREAKIGTDEARSDALRDRLRGPPMRGKITCTRLGREPAMGGSWSRAEADA